MQLANFLKVPVVYFFEDYPSYDNSTDKKVEAEDSEEERSKSKLKVI